MGKATKLHKKVLIVDDNDVNRKYANSVLSKDNLEVREANGGLVAIAICQDWQPDLILLDIQMPDIDGFETLDRIRALSPPLNCPVLAVTAFSGLEERSKFLQKGFDDFLVKPIKPDDLISEVRNWLQISQTRSTISINNPIGKIDTFIDSELLKGLLKYTDIQGLTELLEEFETETSKFFEQLSFLVPAKNYPEILSILHTIKGNAGSLGLPELSEKSKALEAELRSGQALELEDRVHALAQIFDNFRKTYKKELNFLRNGGRRL